MNNCLKDYSNLIKEYAHYHQDIIDQGILLLNIIHDAIAYYREKFGNIWYFVKHEDLSLNPMSEFAKLFTQLNLIQSFHVTKYITQSTNLEHNSNLKGDSLKNIKAWENRLGIEEITRIKNGTENV